MAWDMKIIISGKPIPKARARYSKRGKHVITYDPQEYDKRHVRSLMSQQIAAYANSEDRLKNLELGKICAGKVFSVDFTFFLPINQSDSVVARNKKLWGITKASTKPDYDNLEKFYLDCANGILWGDDASVIKASAQKLYSNEPRVEIVVDSVEKMKLPENIEKVISCITPKEFLEIKDISQKISDICIEDICDDMYLVKIASALSQLALGYANSMTKIAKLGDITSEVKRFEEFKDQL